MLTIEKEQELLANGFRRTRQEDSKIWHPYPPEEFVAEFPWIRDEMPYSIPYLEAHNVADVIRFHEQHKATMRA